MKLLFVCQGVPKLSDGSLLIACQLAKFLSKRHEVDLIFLKTPEERTSPPPFFKNVTAVPFKPKRSFFHRLKNIISLKPNLVSLYASGEMKNKIYGLCGEKRYDIIIAMTMNMAQYVSHIKGVRKVVMPHDAEHLIYRQILGDAKGVMDKTKAWLWWKKACAYQRKVYPFFDRCIVVSERDKTALLNLSDSPLGRPADRIKVDVLPSGIDTGFFKASEKTLKKDILIFTGVMNTWSNVDAAAYFVREIFPIIEKELPSIKFSIAGKRPSARVKKFACKNIIVTGEVPDIRQYLREALIFVAPFRIGTGLKHKILEAMAMGIPVVSTTLGANGIDVKSGEDIILADTPEEFAKACVNLYNNDSLREKIIKNASALVREKYSWERIGQGFEDMLKEVLKN